MRIGRLRLALLLLAAFAPGVGAESWCNAAAVDANAALVTPALRMTGSKAHFSILMN
jgi:hypothetical protein